MVNSLDVYSLMDRDRRSIKEYTSSESTVRIHGPTLSVPGSLDNMLASRLAQGFAESMQGLQK